MTSHTLLNSFQILPDVYRSEPKAPERNSDTSPRIRDFPTTIISDPLLYHFTQEQNTTCSSPLQSLRSSIETVPQQLVSKFRRHITRSRSGSDSASSNSTSTGNQTDLLLQSPSSGSSLVSEPTLEEQYLHLGNAPT